VLNDIMSGRDYINPNDDQLCEEECFDFMGTRISNIIDNWYHTEDQEIQTRSVENAAAITDEVSISNVDKRGCLHTVSTPRSIEGSFTRSAESPLITASPKETLHPNALHIMGHTASSSRMAPVNPAYLCIDVTDCIVRPKIITIPNNSPKNAYQNHVRGEYSDTTDHIFLYNEVSAINECSTLGTQKTSQSQPLQIAMSKEPSSNRNVPRRPRNQGDTLSYIDLGGKIYMPPLPDPPVFIHQLLRNSHFMEHIKAYNQMFAMTGGPPQRINKLHQSYMYLQFPLLFIFGQPGFYPDLVLKPRDGRVFCAIEQRRLDFIRKHQNDLQSDYLLVVYIIEFQKRDTRGYKVVTKLMMHGPCGAANPGAACMENEACNKHFPKKYNEKTFFDSNSHKHYQRRQTEVHIRKENMQRVNFREKDRLDIIVNMPDKKKTTLTKWATCEALDPPKLWRKHWTSMQDDIPAKVSEATGILNYHVNTPGLQEYILYELEAILN
ncbi:hypothetical protein Tco_1506563, partial [Tanacetum coccineum]